ncbi:hypothetical protein V8F06_011403 [Rhypophila decipiens]
MASGWLGAYPPPPGVTPDFDNPPSQFRDDIALHATCLTFVTLSVVMRIYTRRCITRAKSGVDDYLCLLSYALTVVFSGLMIKCYTLGIGRHIWDVPAPWLTEALKWFTFASYIYLVLATFIKLVFLFFYRRIFSTECTTRHLINFGIVFVSCLNGGIFFTTVFECDPIQRQWDPTLPGRCINPVILPCLSGATSSATDILVLVIPMRLLWGLNMNMRRKLKILAVFGLGLFACIASLVRLGMTPILRSDFDATWNIGTIAVWATLEVNIDIFCSCLMLLPAFLDHHLPTSVRTSFSRLWSYMISLLSNAGSQSKSSLPSFVNPYASPWHGYRRHNGSTSQSGDQVDKQTPMSAETQIWQTKELELDSVRVEPIINGGNRNLTARVVDPSW